MHLVSQVRSSRFTHLASKYAQLSQQVTAGGAPGTTRKEVRNKTPTSQPSQLAAKTKAESAARSTPIDASPLSLSTAYHIASEA
jgi:hypothetical protein